MTPRKAGSEETPAQANGIARTILDGAQSRRARMILCLEGIVPHPEDDNPVGKDPPCQHSDIDIEDLLAFGYETQWLDGTCAKCDALLRVSVSAIEVKERGV